MPSFTIIRQGPRDYKAVAPDGQVLGFARLSRTLYGLPVQPGRFFVDLVVEPEYRRQGIGAALYAVVERKARRTRTATLACSVAPDDRDALTFANRRGFVIEHRMLNGELDLQRFDPAPWVGAVATAESRGIRFTTLLQAQDGPDVLKNLYELDRHCSADVPDWSGVMPPFDDYCEALKIDNDLGGSFLAWEGGELVGFAFSSAAEDGTGYTGFLGVARTHRGRGIALALKLLTIQWAKQRGLTRLLSNNNAANESIIGLNRKLGYTLKPGEIHLMKALVSFRYIAQSVLSFAVFVGLYVWWQDWWQGAALGAVVLAHQWGHWLAARSRSVRLLPPTFLPFVGALVRPDKYPVNPANASLIAGAGPVAGLAASALVWGLGASLHSGPLTNAAYLGFLIQAIQLLPIDELDGGLFFRNHSRWVWYAMFPISAYYSVALKTSVPIVIVWPALAQALKASPREDLARVPATFQVINSLVYIVLMGVADIGVWRVGISLNGGLLVRWLNPRDPLDVWFNVGFICLMAVGYLIYNLIRRLGWLTPFKPGESDAVHAEDER